VLERAVTDSRIVVQKFGGTSVATREGRDHVVGHVRRAIDEGFRVAIVVSAMGRRGDPYATDTLLNLLRAEGGPVDPADYALVFVTGEMIAAAVMSHRLKRAGLKAVGLTGGQARIFTDGHPTEADIVTIDTSRLVRHLDRGEVPVVTGGQGIDPAHFDYNTLGRGASDTSGVAVGVALGAQRVEIFTDVEGVATADPRQVPGARLQPAISFQRMYEMARYGAKVVHPRAILAGWRGATPIVVRSTFSTSPGTWIAEAVEEPVVTGIATREPLVTVAVANTLDVGLLQSWEHRRLIISLVSAGHGHLLLGAPDGDVLDQSLAELGIPVLGRYGAAAWISVIGETMALASRLQKDSDRLSAAGARVWACEAGRHRATYVLDAAQATLAVKTLHDLYWHDA
jgi:aspartate kinase